MPGPYTVLNARVKQKINTETQWIAEEADFGVIFEGEQAFVYNSDGVPVNFKIGDGTKTFSELPYFIAYYTGVLGQKVLSYLGQTANLTIPGIFRNNSQLQDFVFLNNSGGTITLNIGTTNGGTELGQIIIPTGPVTIGLKKYFNATTTIYLTGLTGKAYSLFILYFQLDEAPAIPPTGGSGAGVMFAYGTVYAYIPMSPGRENIDWNFIDEIGNPGTQYEGCSILNLPGSYLIGADVGDTIGGTSGNATNNVTLTGDNMPAHAHLMFNSDTQAGGGNDLDDAEFTRFERNGSLSRAYIMAKSGTVPTRGSTSTVGSSVPISVKPKSKIVLYFTGPATT